LPTAPENRLDSTLIHRHTAERQSTSGFIGWLVLAMASIYAKFEVSICTRYEDMKSEAKCKNWGGLFCHNSTPSVTLEQKKMKNWILKILVFLAVKFLVKLFFV